MFSRSNPSRQKADVNREDSTSRGSSNRYTAQIPVMSQRAPTTQESSGTTRSYTSDIHNTTNRGHSNIQAQPTARVQDSRAPNETRSTYSSPGGHSGYAPSYQPPPTNYGNSSRQPQNLGAQKVEVPRGSRSKSTPVDSNYVPNILVFGETGTGKSSVINMIAGSSVAGVSSDALGFTFKSKCHAVSLGGRQIKLWDTAGLNEGEHGTIPAEQAMRNLQDLVHRLNGGVSLLVYCVRGTRFRDISKINYDLFCGIICQKQVPIVLVVTGLEHESPMESWWRENGREFLEHRMDFAGHVCITATKGKLMKSGEHMFAEEFEESTQAVQNLIRNHCNDAPWIMDEKAWLKEITSQLASYYNPDVEDSQGFEQDTHQRERPNYSILGILRALFMALATTLAPYHEESDNNRSMHEQEHASQRDRRDRH